jgi:hypothetical protein
MKSRLISVRPGGRFAVFLLAVLSGFLTPTLLWGQDPVLKIGDGPDPDKAKKTEGPLLVRPNNEKAYYVFVHNPSKDDQKVFVELFSGGKKIEGTRVPLTVKAKDTQLVKFPDPKTPPVKEPKDWPNLPGPPFGSFEIRLSDGEQTLPPIVKGVEILSPRDYVAAEAWYDKKGKRLSVILTPLPALKGGPCKVELVLPPDRLPAMLTSPTETQLEGELKPGGEKVELFAKNFTFKSAAELKGSFYVNVDGVKRAFVFDLNFNPQDDMVRAKLVEKPGVRVYAPRYVKPGVKVPLRIEPEATEIGKRAVAFLDVALYREGKVRHDQQEFTGARQQVLRYLINKGALWLHASVQDWVPVINTAGMMGKGFLQAMLLDKDRNPIGTFRRPITVEEQPPVLVKLEPVPKEVVRGKTLLVKAYSIDPEFEIKSAKIFVGENDKKGTPASLVMVKNTPFWQAKLDLPDAKGKVDLSVQAIGTFDDGEKLTMTDSLPLQLIDPPPPGPAEKTGTIKGVVREDDRKQPGLKVILQDAKGGTVAETKTKDDGTYLFAKVPPGMYRIVSFKPSNNRSGAVSAQVVAGQTTEADPISLLLGGAKK